MTIEERIQNFIKRLDRLIIENSKLRDDWIKLLKEYKKEKENNNGKEKQS